MNCPLTALLASGLYFLSEIRPSNANCVRGLVNACGKEVGTSINDGAAGEAEDADGQQVCSTPIAFGLKS